MGKGVTLVSLALVISILFLIGISEQPVKAADNLSATKSINSKPPNVQAADNLTPMKPVDFRPPNVHVADNLTPTKPVDFRPPVTPKVRGLDSELVRLVDAKERGQLALAARELRLNVKDNKALVIINAMPGKVTRVIELAKSLGCDIQMTYENGIQAMAPVTALRSLAASDNISMVSRPQLAIPNTVSQGVSAMNASVWQAAGYTGTGTKIGILDVGFNGYSNLLGNELPASVSTWGDLGIGNHGTACAEVIYDIAPGAQFYLAKYGSQPEYGNAVNWLIGQGVNVISHSVCNYYGPGGGTGAYCSPISNARNAGITWVQSAGNYARTHWKGDYSDTNGDGWHEFSGAWNVNYFTANAGEEISAFLRWNDTWGASGNDYDLFLYYWDGSSWQEVKSCRNPQTGSQDPVEWIGYQANSTGYYGLLIQKWNATGNATTELIADVSGSFQFNDPTYSLGVPADSGNAISVGAVYWDPYYNYNIELTSSLGPTNDYRTKPDLVGYDGVSTSTSAPNSFWGTSAAAPHVAGAALLVKNFHPNYTPAQIQNYLESNAIHIDPPTNNTYGSGRVYLPLTIAASAGAGGSISPSGDIIVTSGANQTFTITPYSGNSIASLTVDGTPIVPPVSPYTFTKVTIP